MPSKHCSAKILFIQVRPADHPMTVHERFCLQRRLSPLPVSLVVRNVFAETPDASWLKGVDGVVIGGSGSFSVNDPQAATFLPGLRSLLDACMARDIPGFGICFGHQLLGLHFGAPVHTVQDFAEQGTHDYETTMDGQQDPVFSSLSKAFRGHTGHADHVAFVPDGLVLMARNTTLATQGFKVAGARFYSTQFHPDLTAEEARLRYRACGSYLATDAEELERQVARFDTNSTDTTKLLAHFAAHMVFQHARPHRPPIKLQAARHLAVRHSKPLVIAARR